MVQSPEKLRPSRKRKLGMLVRNSPQRIYELFNSSYFKSKETVLAAVSLDEQSDRGDEKKKREVMDLYRKGIREFEAVLKISINSVPPDKLVEVQKHREAIEKHLKSTKGRLSDLEKIYPHSLRGRAAVSNIIPHVRPVNAVAPSTSGARMIRNVRTVSTTDRIIASNAKFSRAELLKGVDEKFGGPLLDEILDSTGVSMSEIEGADSAKEALEEAVILPGLNPTLFSGLRQPVQGILLFGPPGNGKTMLARALATECGSTVFLNVSAATLTSKWVGDAEKIIRALFQIARNGQPSIVFIDELDSILCERSEKDTEVSRRMKTEFLIQMDGICSSKTDRLLVVGATNRPYELDSAVLRRFPKRILIDLPEENARSKLLTSLLKKHRVASDLRASEIRDLAIRTEGYSFSDLVALCREAAMLPIREMSRFELKNATESQLRPIQMRDFKVALSTIKPSTSKHMREKLRLFADDSGQKM